MVQRGEGCVQLVHMDDAHIPQGVQPRVGENLHGSEVGGRGAYGPQGDGLTAQVGCVVYGAVIQPHNNRIVVGTGKAGHRLGIGFASNGHVFCRTCQDKVHSLLFHGQKRVIAPAHGYEFQVDSRNFLQFVGKGTPFAVDLRQSQDVAHCKAQAVGESLRGGKAECQQTADEKEKTGAIHVSTPVSEVSGMQPVRTGLPGFW